MAEGAQGPGFTEQVRQELSGVVLARACDRRAELAALLRAAGTLHLSGSTGARDHVRLEVASASGAVARRAFGLVVDLYGVRPELRVRLPGGVRHRPTYVVTLHEAARRIGTDLGLLDASGGPLRRPLLTVVAAPCDATAYLRGAFLACASVSAPGRPPHLEFAAEDELLLRDLGELLGRATGSVGRVTDGRRGWRIAVKSGERIGALLASLGAGEAATRWDEQRRRKRLRAEATRLANADAANVRRTVAAAASQIREVERAVEVLGWQALPEELREVALARLANPAASLSEIGELFDPAVGKSVVVRRLARLGRMAREAASGAD